jgi:hypothetical protein
VGTAAGPGGGVVSFFVTRSVGTNGLITCPVPGFLLATSKGCASDDNRRCL